jgi:hypothetical protein
MNEPLLTGEEAEEFIKFLESDEIKQLIKENKGR